MQDELPRYNPIVVVVVLYLTLIAFSGVGLIGYVATKAVINFTSEDSK